MAAALLLSVDSPGPTFPVVAGAAGAPGNGVGAAGVTSWNRSLDRALEEAAANGHLNLSGRKLKEFPKSASNHDLTDTTRAGERGRERGVVQSRRSREKEGTLLDHGATGNKQGRVRHICLRVREGGPSGRLPGFTWKYEARDWELC